ncbi:MAG: acylphosphatase [Candidatus Binatia bacterium]
MAGGGDTTLRLRLRIRGRVQGVWFREATRQQAERLGVRGWVKNCADGSVEAVLEGDAAAVRAMQAWCHEGPPAARVLEVQAGEEEPAAEKGFRVRH